MGRALWGRRLFAAALLAALPTEAAAQYFGRNKVQYDDPAMRVLSTEHFDIYHADAEEDAARIIGQLAERWNARLSRALQHQLTGRQPLVLYASHRGFQQTNLMPGLIDEGTGGFTESRKRRIVLPFAATLAETDHVLGHEIVHAFQYDIAARHRTGLALPLWLIEGMAEYLSLGPDDPLTQMWMRDAVRQEALPTIRQLSSRKYFPYRWGAALWSYLTARFGADLPARVLRTRRGALDRLERTTGVTAAQLSDDWHAELRRTHAAGPDWERIGEPSVSSGRGGGRLNLGSSISPDGRHIIFLSERDQLSVDVYLADAATGRVRRKLITTAASAEFESLQYLHSSGSWDPEGRRFALATVRRGRPVLTILDVEAGERVREIRFDDLDEVFSPAWAPSGRALAFAGLRSGTSDLYTYELATESRRRLTNDQFSDLDPAWSPDGRTIAFISDRFTSDLPRLHFGPTRVALLDLESGDVNALPAPDGSMHIDPAWSPDGRSVFFVADEAGVPNVFRVSVADRTLFRVTDATTGVSGLTRLSPALSIAQQSGALAFSVYRSGAYEIRTMTAGAALEGTPVDSAPVEPANEPSADTADDDSTIEQPILTAAIQPRDGDDVAVVRALRARSYRPKLTLEAFGPPYFSAGGGVFGSSVRAGGSVLFGDMLGDRQFFAAGEVSSRIEESAIQALYVNRESRWNWGFGLEQVPDVRVGQRRLLADDESTIAREHLRLLRTQRRAGVFVAYPFSRSTRVEVHAGVRQIGFAREGQTQVFSTENGRLLEETDVTFPADPAIVMGETMFALVKDTSVFGATGPVLGARYRVQVAPAVGNVSLTNVLVDYRRYFMPVRPYTVALRVLHSGRYGGGADDPRLRDAFIGSMGLVRGYGSRAVARAECGGSRVDCEPLERLTGNRLLVTRLEMRVPVLGAFTSRFRYTMFPMDALAFFDAGTAWGGKSPFAARRPGETIISSAGAGVRINALAFILEVTAVRPLTMTGAGWSFAFDIRPGF